MKTLQSFAQSRSMETRSTEASTDMSALAAQFNTIEPGAGESILQSFELSAILGAIGLFGLAAVLISQTLSAHFAYKRAKNRLL